MSNNSFANFLTQTNLYDETQGNTSSFDRKLSSSGARKNRQIIIKEEGSKEEDRQEEADVKKKKINKKKLRMDTQI